METMENQQNQGIPENTLSLEEVLEQAAPYIAWMLGKYRIPEQEREDVLAVAVLAAVRCWGEIRSPQSWLIGTLRHECLQYWRRRRRRPELGMESWQLEKVGGSSSPQPWRRVDLERALSRLEPRRQRVFREVYEEGWSCGEAAERGGYKSSGGSKIVERCRRTLATALSGGPISSTGHPLF